MLNYFKQKKFFKLFSFLPMIFFMCIIFSFSAQTGDESGSLSHTISTQVIQTSAFIFQQDWSNEEIETYADFLEYPLRKLAHMTEFFFFSLTVIFPLFVYGLRGKKLILSTLLVCIVFAGSDEYHQSFVADRGPSIKDVFIDSIGACLGTVFGYLFTKRGA